MHSEPDKQLFRSDEDVDEIVAGWEAQRPDFDAQPLAIFSRMLRVGKHLDRIRRLTFAQYGLEVWEFEMLAQLRRAPRHQLTAGQMMQGALVSSGTITNRLDRMEEHGFVERQIDQNDKRVVLVDATEKGIIYVDRAMEALLDVQRSLLAEVSDEDGAIVVRFLKQMLEALGEEGKEDRESSGAEQG